MSVVSVTPDSALQSRLREALEYRDGALFWVEPNTGRTVGARAGGLQDPRGHRTICIDRQIIKEHRAVFLYHHGWLPSAIDHIDGDPGNNKVENLRPCTYVQNGYNQKGRGDRASRFKGVSWHNRKKPYRAVIQVNKKRMHLGYFATEEEAHAAYSEAAKRFHGDFANTG